MGDIELEQQNIDTTGLPCAFCQLTVDCYLIIEIGRHFKCAT